MGQSGGNDEALFSRSFLYKLRQFERIGQFSGGPGENRNILIDLAAAEYLRGTGSIDGGSRERKKRCTPLIDLCLRSWRDDTGKLHQSREGRFERMVRCWPVSWHRKEGNLPELGMELPGNGYVVFSDGTPFHLGEGGSVQPRGSFPPSMMPLQGPIRTALARGRGWRPNHPNRWPEELGTPDDLGDLRLRGPFLRFGGEPRLYPIPLVLFGKWGAELTRLVPGGEGGVRLGAGPTAQIGATSDRKNAGRLVDAGWTGIGPSGGNARCDRNFTAGEDVERRTAGGDFAQCRVPARRRPISVYSHPCPAGEGSDGRGGCTRIPED